MSAGPLAPTRRYRFLPLFGALMLVGLGGLALVSYLRARDLLERQIQRTTLPLVSETIEQGLRQQLLQPVLAAGLMARNNLLVQQVLQGEHQPEALRDYLANARLRTGAVTAFLVSDRSLRYYHPDGVLKRVSPRDPQDAWYFRFRASGLAQDLNIDRDTADLQRTTAFINVRLQDPSGRFLGAIGLGLDMRSLTDQLRRYQQRYGARILLVDGQGRIRLAADDRKAHLNAVAGLAAHGSAILGQPAQALRYGQGPGARFVSSRRLPELGWVLVVIQRASLEQRSLLTLLGQTLITAVAITSVLVVVGHLTLGAQQRQLETLASTDSLTGLLNRNRFDSLFTALATESQRRQQPLAVVLIDIDHFKRVNDRYGHPTGDRVIGEVGRRIADHSRPDERLFRWGGEEYLLLLPGFGLAAARARLEAIRVSLRQQPLGRPALASPAAEGSGPADDGVLAVSLSFGLTLWRIGETSAELLQRADQALYMAKRDGRDRIGTLDPGGC